MIIAIDIGGTKTLVVSFDTDGHKVTEDRFATPKDPEVFMKTLIAHLTPFNPQDIKAVAVAAPGPIDVEKGEIIYSPNLKWSYFPLKKRLAAYFACPIIIENDANVAGLGATQALETIPRLSLYISIGTGIGTGVIVNGVISPVFSHSEGGHMVFKTPQGHQTWEECASGRAITKKFSKFASEITDKNAWHSIASEFAVGFSVLIPMLQPDIIIIGGGIGAYFDKFEKPLREILRQNIPTFISIPPFKQAIDPEKAVIHGCYYHALTSLKIH